MESKGTMERGVREMDSLATQLQELLTAKHIGRIIVKHARELAEQEARNAQKERHE